jgi:acyl carrier protein
MFKMTSPHPVHPVAKQQWRIMGFGLSFRSNAVSPNPEASPEDDPALREALKRCSPATYYAACKFKTFRRTDDLRVVVLGVVERFVERELRQKLAHADDTLRLREDLGLDSLTMMEVVMIAEEVLQITVSNEELTHLRTLADVQSFILAKTLSASPNAPSKLPAGNRPSKGAPQKVAISDMDAGGSHSISPASS